MTTTRRIAITAAFLGLLAGVAGARVVEVDPYRAGGLTEWTLTPTDRDAWSLANDILTGETKAFFEATAVFDGEVLDAFSLFFQVDGKQRRLSILLVPEEGDPVELEIDRRWVDRRAEFTLMKLDVGGGKATLYRDEDEQESWDVPEGKYKVGFQLGKNGQARLKRIRLTFDRKPPPRAPVPAGFVDLLEPTTWNRLAGVPNQPNAVAGEWNVEDGVLHCRNPDTQKFTARIIQAAGEEYEARFKVRAGARELRFQVRFAIQGRPDAAKVYALDGYCTGADEWNSFVIRYGDGKTSMTVNGLDVVQNEATVPGRTPFAIILGQGGEAQIRDFHLRMPGLSAPAPAAGSGGDSPGAGSGGAPGAVFDGKSLETFKQYPDQGVWEVVDRGILGLNGSGKDAYLFYRMGRVTDFSLKFRVEMGTAGLGVFAKYDPDQQKGTVIEVPAAALNRAYNVCQVIVRGSTCRLLVNGQQISAVQSMPGNLLFGFLLKAGGRCRIRDLEVGP
jgi:hypothetical protein